MAREGLFNNESGVRARISEAMAEQPTGVVWLVGHGVSQAALQKLFASTVVIPKPNHAAVIAFEQVDGHFRLVAWFAGTP